MIQIRVGTVSSCTSNSKKIINQKCFANLLLLEPVLGFNIGIDNLKVHLDLTNGFLSFHI